MVRSGLKHCLRCSAADRVHHPIVDAAPTELVLQGVLDFFLAGIWIAVQQDLCGHDHAVGAVPALSGLLVDERSLQRVRFLDGTQSLERGDLIFTDVPQGDRACPCEFSAQSKAFRAAAPMKMPTSIVRKAAPSSPSMEAADGRLLVLQAVARAHFDDANGVAHVGLTPVRLRRARHPPARCRRPCT